MSPSDQKTQALVLGVVKYGDHGHVIRTFTPAYGLKAFMIHSLRSRKSGGFRASMTLALTALEGVIDARGKGNLSRFSEVHPLHHWKTLHTDPVKMTICTFGAEVISKVITEDHPDPGLFTDVMQWLVDLDQSEEVALAPQKLLLIASRHLGCFPHSETYSEGSVFDQMDGHFIHTVPHHTHWMNSEESASLYYLINGGKDLPKSVRVRLLDELLAYLRIHHEPFGTMKSLDIIRTLLS